MTIAAHTVTAHAFLARSCVGRRVSPAPSTPRSCAASSWRSCAPDQIQCFAPPRRVGRSRVMGTGNIKRMSPAELREACFHAAGTAVVGYVLGAGYDDIRVNDGWTWPAPV